jgi:protein TonB
MSRTFLISLTVSVIFHILLLSVFTLQVEFSVSKKKETTVTLSFSELKVGSEKSPRKESQRTKKAIRRKAKKPPKRTRKPKQIIKKPQPPPQQQKTTAPLVRKESSFQPNHNRVIPKKEAKKEEEEHREVATKERKEDTIKGNPQVEKDEERNKSFLEETGGSRKSNPLTSETTKKEFNKEKYIAAVIAEIEKNKFYPPIARRMGIEGLVKVTITLSRSGKLKNVKVSSSSGSKLLDRAAVKLIKKCHFPPLPSEYKGQEFTIEIPINYVLR